jgi:hypothetical protein
MYLVLLPDKKRRNLFHNNYIDKAIIIYNLHIHNVCYIVNGRIITDRINYKDNGHVSPYKIIVNLHVVVTIGLS